MAVRKLDVIISVVDQFSGDMDTFVSGVDDMVTPVATLTKDLLLLEAAVGAVASVFAAFAVSAAADFETSMGNIGTLVAGLAEDEIPGLTAAILELSTEVPQTAVQIADAFYDIQSATGAGVKGFELMEVSAKAAIAGLTDTKTAADLLTTVMNSMGYEMSQATEVADVLFATVVEGKVTFDQLAANMGSFTAVANSAGLSLEQVGAAYATLTVATGLQAESATFLRGAIFGLLKIQGKSAKAFKQYGIATHDATGKIRNLLDVIRDIKDAGLGLEEITKMFPRMRGAQAVNILAQRFDLYEKKLGTTTNAQDLMITSFVEMSKTWENRWAAMSSTYKRFQIQVGGSLKDTFTPLIESIRKVFEALGAWEAETQSIQNFIQEYLKPVVEDLSEALNTLSTNFSGITEGVDMTPIFDSLDGLQEILESLVMIDFTSVEGWVTALQAVVDVAAGVINVTTGIVNGLKILIPAIGYAIEKFRNMDEETQEAIGKFLGISTSIDALIIPVKGLSTAIGGLTSILKTLAVVGLGAVILKGVLFKGAITSIGAILSGSLSSGLLAAYTGMVTLSAATAAFTVGSGLAFGYFLDKTVGQLPIVEGFLNSIADGMVKVGQEGRENEFLTESQARLAEEYGITSGKLSDLMDAMNNTSEAAEQMGETEESTTEKTNKMKLAIMEMGEALVKTAEEGKEDIKAMEEHMDSLKGTAEGAALAIANAAKKFTEIEKAKKAIASINELWHAGLITAKQAELQIGKLTEQIQEFGGTYTLVEKVQEAMKQIAGEERAIKQLEEAVKKEIITENEASRESEKHRTNIEKIKESYKGLGEAHQQEIIHIQGETFEILKMGGQLDELKSKLSQRLGLEIDASQASGEIQRIDDKLVQLTQDDRYIDVYVRYHDEGSPE